MRRKIGGLDEPVRLRQLEHRYERSRALLERARSVIPGGVHLSGRALVDYETTPSYFDRGKGARLYDVDGHEYVDYLMAFGAQLLGYAHDEVDAAAYEQARRGNLLSLNHPLHIQLVEALLSRFTGMSQAVFLKTGSEATTVALRIARAHTGRRLVVRAGYHGWHDWCLPLEPYVPAHLDQQVLEFRASDPDSLRAVLERHPGQVAAVIVAPEMVLPHEPAVFHELARVAHSHGSLLVMDEVKTGLRIAPGSVSARVGLVPDLLTVSKALGNGYPVAATLGTERVMQAAVGMHYSATYHGETSAMAAALTTLRISDAQNVPERLDALGRRLLDGLNAWIDEEGIAAECFPEPFAAMPFFRFTDPNPDERARLSRAFYREVLADGHLLHPRHLWFVSAAHTEQDVDATLAACRRALQRALEVSSEERPLRAGVDRPG